MFKFKVGDKVRLREEVLPFFPNYQGIYEIIEIRYNSSFPYQINLGCTEFACKEDELELAEKDEYITVGLVSGVPETFWYDIKASNVNEVIKEMHNDSYDYNDYVPDEITIYKKVKVVRKKTNFSWE